MDGAQTAYKAYYDQYKGATAAQHEEEKLESILKKFTSKWNKQLESFSIMNSCNFIV